MGKVQCFLRSGCLICQDFTKMYGWVATLPTQPHNYSLGEYSIHQTIIYTGDQNWGEMIFQFLNQHNKNIMEPYSGRPFNLFTGITDNHCCALHIMVFSATNSVVIVFETRNMSDRNRRFGASCAIVKVT